MSSNTGERGNDPNLHPSLDPAGSAFGVLPVVRSTVLAISTEFSLDALHWVNSFKASFSGRTRFSPPQDTPPKHLTSRVDMSFLLFSCIIVYALSRLYGISVSTHLSDMAALQDLLERRPLISATSKGPVVNLVGWIGIVLNFLAVFTVLASKIIVMRGLVWTDVMLSCALVGILESRPSHVVMANYVVRSSLLVTPLLLLSRFPMA